MVMLCKEHPLKFGQCECVVEVMFLCVCALFHRVWV